MSIDTAGSDSIRRGTVAEGASHNKISTNETLAALALPQLPLLWSQKFTIIKVLGEGSFGRVLLCRLNCVGDYFVAVKEMASNNPETANEIDVLNRVTANRASNFDFEYVVNLIGDLPTFSGVPNSYAMIEFLNYGSLSKLRPPNPREPPFDRLPVLLALFHQAARGLFAMHHMNLVHGDIKPDNIMVNLLDGKAYASVIDLGLAKPITMDGTCQLGGTPGYLAPEVLGMHGNMGCPRSCDIWSLGMVMYETFGGRCAQQLGLYQHTYLTTGMPGYYTQFQNIMSCITEEVRRTMPQLADLIEKMLLFDPGQRASARTVLQMLESLIGSRDGSGDALAAAMISQPPWKYGAKFSNPAMNVAAGPAGQWSDAYCNQAYN